ncbi:MAG: creatininase family protein [Lentisphaerae bacterium]|nr:creatininase family protein [Lentisphaerota bacterium]
MRWNEMTAQEIVEARDICGGVCVVPMGCIERHGSHLPTGMDVMQSWHFADMAAQLEPFMVFPGWYLGSLSDCTFAPGTIAFPLDLCVEALEQLCAEISRNGYKKILLINSHGGNGPLIDFFMQRFCEKDRDYMVYTQAGFYIGKKYAAARKKLVEEANCTNGHAGGPETAIASYLFPECMNKSMMLPPETGIAEERCLSMQEAGLRVPAGWFAAHPHHSGGWGGEADAEHGRAICEGAAEDIAGYVRAIKEDDTSLEIFREFREKTRHPEL